MTKKWDAVQPASQLDKLTGAVTANVWNLLSSDKEFSATCIGLLPALTFQIKQYLSEFGLPKSDTDVAILARSVADRTEMVLEFFHLKVNERHDLKIKIEEMIKKEIVSHDGGKNEI